jgi:hypothetical protein
VYLITLSVALNIQGDTQFRNLKGSYKWHKLKSDSERLPAYHSSNVTKKIKVTRTYIILLLLN